MPPTSIDGTDITGATIDGTDVTEITVDGQTVFKEVSLSPNAINQYDATTLSAGTITQWDDSVGSLNLTGGSPEVVSNGINGNKSVRFDGNDVLDSATRASNISQPFTVAVVVETFTSAARNIFDGVNIETILRDRQGSNNDNFRLFAGNILDSTETALNDPSVVVAIFDGSSSKIRVNSTEFTGNAGTNANDGVTLGARGSRNDSTGDYDGDIGEVVVYDVALSGTDLTDEEDRLKNKFGITF